MHYGQHGEDPPHYVMYPGEDCGMFSVEVVHNGFFCGLRDNLEYVVETTSQFDNLTVDTWSLTWIDEILKILGHERDERTSVYWLLPDKDLRDGLVLVKERSHIRDMINASKYHKPLVLFVDHTNFLKGLRPDAIVGHRPAPRPAPASRRPAPAAPRLVLSAPSPAPATPRLVPSAPREAPVAPSLAAAAPRPAPASPRPASDAPILVPTAPRLALAAPRPAPTAPSLVPAALESEVSDSEEEDLEFYDSDFDVEDGDDDLFADNVDKFVNDNNEQEPCEDNEDEDALEDDALNLTSENRQHLIKNIKAFNPEVDMDNPTFKIGMVFSGVVELRKAVTTYGIRNRVKIKKLRNEARRYEAMCAPGYSWRLKASNDPRRTGGFIITEYEGSHKCEGSFPVSAITAKVLAEKFMHEFRDNQKLDLKSFAAKVLREFKMCPQRWKLSRARKAALLQIHGDEEGQFKQLFDYGQDLRRSNPGSKFFVTTNSVGDAESPQHKEHLATVYWSYDACKRGFLAGCRPFICLDGCHIKTKYKGVLLTAIGIDPNDCIYPVAFGIAEVECTTSWEWFLTNLRDDLNITNTAPWTIMSDKQKGLINVVQKVFPDSEHRFCVRHMIQNFQRAGHRPEGVSRFRA
uniref:Uncharacterized protein n=1 Tax=Avena sativa TaxID=4498 RepID=A0ACD5ZRE6_AVESA